MKVLVIRFKGQGEVLMTNPVIRAIRQKYPEARIHYLTLKENVFLVESFPEVNKVHSLESDLVPVVFDLLKEKFDFILDLQSNYKSHFVKRNLRHAYNAFIKVASYKKYSIRKWLRNKTGINFIPDLNLAERFFEPGRKLGLVNDGQGIKVHIPEKERISRDDIPLSHSAGYISVCIETMYPTRNLLMEQWNELVTKIDYPIILHGSSAVRQTAAEIASIDPIRIYNSCGKFTYFEEADIMSKAKVVVSPENDRVHLAAAFQRKIVYVLGNTVAHFGTFPYYGYNNLKSNISPHLRIIEKVDLSCRPCSLKGKDRCPKKHFKCIRELSVDRIVNEVNHLLSQNKL